MQEDSMSSLPNITPEHVGHSLIRNPVSIPIISYTNTTAIRRGSYTRAQSYSPMQLGRRFSLQSHRTETKSSSKTTPSACRQEQQSMQSKRKHSLPTIPYPSHERTVKIDTTAPSTTLTTNSLSCDKTGPIKKSQLLVDFSSIMFLSTGGATVAVADHAASSETPPSGVRVSEGSATWEDYKPFARRLFFTVIFPACALAYLSCAFAVYFATVRNWDCRVALACTLSAGAGALTLFATVWTGSVAYHLRDHRVVANRGLVFVAQVHLAAAGCVPMLCAYVLMDARVFAPSTVVRLLMDLYISTCLFLFFSAVIARQRQMYKLFGEAESLSVTSKNTYRNTVLCIGVAYVIANILRILLVWWVDDGAMSYAPILVAYVGSLLLWFRYTYLSRHASSRFSDYDQLRRLCALYAVALMITHAWGFFIVEAFIVQSFVIMGLLSIFLLDSYLSLFHFIRYKLDPRCAREVNVFSAHPDGITSQVIVTTTVACIASEQNTAHRRASLPSRTSTRTSELKSRLTNPSTRRDSDTPAVIECTEPL